MKALLAMLLPRLLPDAKVQLVAHQGKADLDRSMPTKLRAYAGQDVQFVILRDTDGADCRALKRRLSALCAANGQPDTLVRLVCQELEAWYLGDLAALFDAYDLKATANNAQAKYRDPDAISKPSAEVKRLVPAFQKTDGARRMGARLDCRSNRSVSFGQFCLGVWRITGNAEVGGHV